MRGTPKRLSGILSAVDFLKDLLGGKVALKVATEEMTVAAAAYTDTAMQLPAYCIPLAVTARVKTLIPTATTFDIGISGATTRFGSSIAVAAGTTSKVPNLTIPSTATALRLTPDSSPATATGKVIISMYYLEFTAPSRNTKQ